MAKSQLRCSEKGSTSSAPKLKVTMTDTRQEPPEPSKFRNPHRSLANTHARCDWSQFCDSGDVYNPAQQPSQSGKRSDAPQETCEDGTALAWKGPGAPRALLAALDLAGLPPAAELLAVPG